MLYDLRFDLQVDNFNRLFSLEISKMTDDQKKKLPAEILAKIFKIGGSPTERNMNFMLRLFILYQALGKQIYLVLLDENATLGISDFEKFQKEQKRRKYSEGAAEHYLSKGIMVVGNKDLIEYISYLNYLSTSPVYKYLISMKNHKSARMPDTSKEFSYICNFLINYEGNKKKIARHENINVPDLYVLYYLADGREKTATPAYIEVFRYCANASRKQILDAFKKLNTMGYIQSVGKARATTYRISPSGKELLYRIIYKYMIA